MPSKNVGRLNVTGTEAPVMCGSKAEIVWHSKEGLTVTTIIEQNLLAQLGANFTVVARAAAARSGKAKTAPAVVTITASAVHIIAVGPDAALAIEAGDVRYAVGIGPLLAKSLRDGLSAFLENYQPPPVPDTAKN